MPSRSTAKATSTSAKTSTAGASSGSFTREWARLPATLFHRRNRSVASIKAEPAASDGPPVALDLGAVHDPPAVRVKGVAPVHGAAIVPQNEIANAPRVLPGEFRPIDKAPQLVKQRLGVRKVEPNQVGVAAAAEIEHAPAGVGVRAHQRV